MGNNAYIENLVDFENLLKNEKFNVNGDLNKSPLIFVKESDVKYFLLDESKVYYRKVPELSVPRFLFALKLLQALNNQYIPIFNLNKQLLYTEEEFQEFRKKMSGIKEYNAGNFVISDNLSLQGLDYYTNLIDDNFRQVNEKRTPVVNEFIKIMNSIGLSTTIGNNSGGDVELVEAGSTMRGTNLPSNSNANWDFDYTVRIDPDKVWKVKEALENGFKAEQHITKTSAYKVRLAGVKIPNMENLIDLDFSLTPQKEKYLSTEDAITEQLENIKMQDEKKYKLVLANIMFAKAFLKHAGVYKPSRGILDGDRQFGGIGGVGIENWVLQHGGSFIDAAKDFVEHAEGKEFMEFQKEYAIMDFGKNHVEVSKGYFPYDNFVMKNMRYKGYELMKSALKQVVDNLSVEEERNIEFSSKR